MRPRTLAVIFSSLILLGAGVFVLAPRSAALERADFTFINRGDNKSLDPNTMSWMQDIRLAYALWEGLYSLDPITLQPIPGSADPIEISPDQMRYTFHIRATARWSNGDPVVAADFIFAWRRMLEHPGDYTYLLLYIRGARPYEEEFAKGNLPDFDTVGIRSPDPKTLIVTLEHPVTFFPSLCAFPPFFPLNERSMGKFAEVDTGTGMYGNFDHKATGGTQISDVTAVGSGANIGEYSDTTRTATWNDGLPANFAVKEHAYLGNAGALNTGLTFTAPADTGFRTLTVYTGANSATLSFNAHLTDGSAPDYLVTAGKAGLVTNAISIKYRAAAIDKKLVVTLLKTGNVGGTQGTVDLIAATLSDANSASPATAFLKGTVSTAPSTYDLTALGSSDWAHWGRAGQTTYDQRFTRPPSLQTNGPYQMSEWTFKRRIRLRANPYYWDASRVKSKIIDQIYADDPLSAYLQYNDGQIDWLSEVSGELAAELRKQNRADLHVFPSFGTYFYSINCQPKLPDGRANPLADIRVRRALAMAIDKRPIVETVTRMGEPIVNTYIPPGIFPDYRSPEGQPFDIKQAQQLLADAGYPDGKGFPPITILINSEGQHSQIAQIVQHQWRTNLHLDLSLDSVEVKILGQRLHGKDYAIARASWYGDYDDPSTFTDKYLSNSDNNDSGWVNAKYDSLCNDAAYEPDPAKRLKLLAQAEKLLLDEVPIIPVYAYVNVYMFRDNVHGLSTNARNMVLFDAISVKR